MKLSVSAVIITLNEARNIKRCLESVGFCSEILVVDSGSTDATVEIAKSMGARVIYNEWPGFGKQKRFGVEQAAYDWVLCLDADEVLSEALRQSIEHLFSGTPKAQVYQVARKDYFLGRWLEHGSYPDMKIRLFHREYAQWTKDMVHERVISNNPVANCEGDLMHYTADSLTHAISKRSKYVEMQARDLYQRGSRPTVTNLVFSPLARFVKLYLLQQGFRDGVAGFLMASVSSFFCLYKYAVVYELGIEADKSEIT